MGTLLTHIMELWSVTCIDHGLLDVVPKKEVDKRHDAHLHNYGCRYERIVVDRWEES